MKRATLMSKRGRLSNNKGFTLIELLVVLSILGLLATTATLKYVDSTAAGRTAKVQSDLQAIDTAIYLFGASHTGIVPTYNNNSDTGIELYMSGSLPDAPVGKMHINGEIVTTTGSGIYTINNNGQGELTLPGVTGSPFTSSTLTQ